MRSNQGSNVLAAFRLVALVAVTVRASGVSFAGPSPYRAWDNYDDCTDPTLCAPAQYLIGQHNRTQTGGGCVTNGCHNWQQGKFPSTSYDGKRVVNGGIPQKGNLTLHLHALREQVKKLIPDPTWEMNGVLDFESWSPIFEQNTGRSWWHSRIYQNLSLDYALEQDPSLASNWSLWYATAEEQFETAAAEFFAETLRTLADVRPKVRWGFYGVPLIQYGLEWCLDLGEQHRQPWGGMGAADPYQLKCGVFNPTFGPVIRAQNDKLARVWRETGAYYPSVYLPGDSLYPSSIYEALNQQFVSAGAAETARLSAGYPSRTTPNGELAPVLPFYWPLYHNDSAAVTQHDLRHLIRNAYLPPLSTQLIIWSGGSKELVTPAFGAIDGPTFRNATLSARQCSERFCSGQGWCTNAMDAFPFDSPPPSSSDAVPCTCYPGYGGQSCGASATD